MIKSERLLPSIVALLASTAGAAPFSFDSAPGRLPKDVVPVDYTVSLTPDVAHLVIHGTERVVLEFRAATATVRLNSLDESLTRVRLDGKPVKAVVSDDREQMTTITLAAPAAVGRHVLTFAYTAKIAKRPHGLFAQDFRDVSGKQGILLSTQMEATDARRMFPCWDEPSFRATFALTATVAAHWTAVSNMPVERREVHGKLATTTFQRTPRMPSYLIEYTAGDIARIDDRADGLPLAVWAVRGREHEGRTALANAGQIIADYNEYFGYRFPLPKLDAIAVPGGFAGAMENWGAITYNDQLLLLGPQSTTGDQQSVYEVQAHEMAHQWFGDLVTMGWWDDIWLNESFASWMAAKETARRHPEWKWWEHEDETKEAAMRADSRLSAHEIQRHVTDELQALNAFDTEITYNKGQAVLRMFESYLGADAFRDGVRGHMKARAYSNATGTDLWNALSAASGRDVAAIASSWTSQPGFPLVTVTSSCDASGTRSVTLSQARFLMAGSDPAKPHWSVPLQVRVGAAGEPRSVLLTGDDQSLAAGRCDEPLSLNAEAIGYFRTAYDAATLATNTRHFGTLQDGDRIALLDDQWALVQADRAPLGSYLALASAMGDDLDTRAWQQIARALDKIEYSLRGTPKHDAFTAYARTLLQAPFGRLGWDARPGEAPAVGELRQTLIGDLASCGDAEVITEARRRFAAFVKDRTSLAPDLQTVVLTAVARDADAATFEQLHAMAKGAGDDAELERSYDALMEVGDPALAARAIEIALSAEIPPQDDAQRVQFIAAVAQRHPQLSWAAFRSNADALLKPHAMFAPLLVAQTLPQIYWNGVPLADLETWIRGRVPAEMNREVESGLEAARISLAQKESLVREAEEFLH